LQLLCQLNQERIVQTILIFVQQVVHFPELLVGGRKLGGLRSRLRIRMHLA